MQSKHYAATVDLVEDIDNPAVIARVASRQVLQLAAAIPADEAGMVSAFQAAQQDKAECDEYAAAAQAQIAEQKAGDAVAQANTVKADAATDAAREADTQARAAGLIGADASPVAFHAVFTGGKTKAAAVADGLAAAQAAADARAQAADEPAPAE